MRFRHRGQEQPKGLAQPPGQRRAADGAEDEKAGGDLGGFVGHGGCRHGCRDVVPHGLRRLNLHAVSGRAWPPWRRLMPTPSAAIGEDDEKADGSIGTLRYATNTRSRRAGIRPRCGGKYAA
jgi:hypothetical protein